MATDESGADDTGPEKPAAVVADPDFKTELKLRCKNAGITVEERPGIEGRQILTIQLPSGRDKRPITVYDSDAAKRLLEIPFEQITLLGNYAAYLDRSNGIIEAGLRALSTGIMRPLQEPLLGIHPFRSNEADIIAAGIELKSDSHGQSITLGLPSPVLAAFGGRAVNRRSVSIRIAGIQTNRHDSALDYLERIANSVLFEIDLLLGVPVTIARIDPPNRRPRIRTGRGSRSELRFPRYEYDQEAMALYWYARSARGMPLLQYLAYYQSLEFYFPVYSQVEAQRRIRNVLKDPTFQVDRDADLGRLLATARTAGARGFGDERTQLRATLQECLDAEELRSFLRADEARKAFFSSKSKALGANSLPIDREESDIRGEVANRIYDIRCKIVHTKSSGDGDVDLLLPFSEEAELLGYDVELIQYVSQKVLVAASRPLRGLGQ
jgi:hypothetical protein